MVHPSRAERVRVTHKTHHLVLLDRLGENAPVRDIYLLVRVKSEIDDLLDRGVPAVYGDVGKIKRSHDDLVNGQRGIW